MKKITFMILMLASLTGYSQLTDPVNITRKQLFANWKFDHDTILINRLHVGDGKFGIDSLGRIIYYNNALPTAGKMLYGNGTYFTTLAAGTANQYLKMNAGATAPEWVTPSFGTGTVTSVGISSTDLSVSGSPVTSSGSITLNINNLAVTDAKINNVAWSKVTGAPAFITDLSSFTTDNLTEGATNLYSQWLGSTDIYHASGNVGIGGAPSYLFDVMSGSDRFITIDPANQLSKFGDISISNRYLEVDGVARTFNLYAGGSPLFQIELNNGKISLYNSIAPTDDYFLVGDGTYADFVSPSDAKTALAITSTDISDFSTEINKLVATPLNLTAQTASTNGTYYTPPSDGYYEISITGTITTTGTSPVIGVVAKWTDANDNVEKSYPGSDINFFNRTNNNNTGTGTFAIQFVAFVKASTGIKYDAVIASGSCTYDLIMTVEKLNY